MKKFAILGPVAILILIVMIFAKPYETGVAAGHLHNIYYRIIKGK